MAGTYWLTILPETSKLRAGIAAAMRGVEYEAPVTPNVDKSGAPADGRDYGNRFSREFKVKPRVDNSKAEAEGRDYGNRFARGFHSATSRIGAAVSGIGASLGVASVFARTLFRNISGIATGIAVAAKIMHAFSLAVVLSSTGLRLLAGVSLVKLAGALKLVAAFAGAVAKQVTRVTSALILLRAAMGVVGAMQKFAKVTAIATVGTAALLGIASALTVTVGQFLWGALVAAGAAMGVAAGAAVGLLGPALWAAKMGFSGLSEAAKQFNKQFKDVDEAFYTMVGERMAPMLTAFHDLKTAVVDTFSSAMIPAFNSLGGVLTSLKPQMNQLATTMGGLFSKLAETVSGPAVSAAFDTMFAASNRFFQSFVGGNGLSALTTGLAQFIATAADTFAQLGTSFDQTLGKFGEWLGSITPTQMVAAFRAVGQVIENIGSMVMPIFNLIREVGAVAAPALAPGIGAIGTAIGQATPGLVRMSEILMPALSQVFERLAPVIPALVQAFTPWSQVLAIVAPPLASIVAQLAPLAPLILTATLAFKAITAAMIVYNGTMLLLTNATKIARAAMWLFNAALLANPIGLIVAAVVALGVALWAFFTKTETGRRLWETIWNGIKTVAGAVFDFLKSAMQFLGEKISWLWNNIAVPAFNGIKSAIETMWNGAKVIWDVFTAALSKVGDKVTAFKDGLVKAFNAVKDVVMGVWDKIGGIIDKIGNGIGKVVDFYKGVGGSVLNAVGLGGGANGGIVVSGYADGGRIRGPGRGRTDSILGFPAMVRVSNGEYVVNAESTAKYLPLLQAINDGALPGFAGGGRVALGNISGPGITTGEQQSMWDAVRTRFPDAVLSSATREVMTEGHPDYHNAGRAIDISGPGMGQVAAWIARTFPDSLELIHSPFNANIKDGKDVGDGLAYYGAGTMNSHQDHVHWALGKTANSGVGASSSASGSSSSGGSYRTATSAELSASSNRVSTAQKSVTQAEQRVDDKTFDRDQAQKRLNQARADGKDTEKADRALYEANRELDDATTDLADKRKKLAEVTSADADLREKGKLVEGSASGSSEGGMDGKSLGQTFVSGILESIGLDGSLFSNPLEWPSVKSAMAGVNFLGGLASVAGGTGEGAATASTVGGFAAGAADSVGLGGLLSAIPSVTDAAPQSVNPAVVDAMTPGGGVSTYAPAANHGSGAAPGAVDNSINVKAQGTDPKQVAIDIKNAFNHRTRSPKVNG